MDYNVLDVTPSVWGPHYWFVIHTYADSYPESPSQLDIEVATSFIKNIPFILPCSECSKHAHDYIKRYYKHLNVITSSNKHLVHFFKSFHDDVNERLGKPKQYLL